MNITGRFAAGALAAAVLCAAVPVTALGAAEPVLEKKTPRDPNDLIYGGRGVTGKSFVAGVLSVIVPGVGQLVDQHKTEKALVHFALGLPAWLLAKEFAPVGIAFTLWRLWSGWDALIDRPGGYLNGILEAPRDPGLPLDASAPEGLPRFG